MQNSFPTLLCAVWSEHVCNFRIIHINNQSLQQQQQKKPSPPHQSATVNPERNPPCDGAVQVILWTRLLTEQSLCFPQELFYPPALISDSFHPLSSPVYDITLLFPPHWSSQHTADVCARLLLHTHTQLCLCSGPLWGLTPVWEHPLILQTRPGVWPPQPSNGMALLRILNNTWMCPFFTRSDNMTLTRLLSIKGDFLVFAGLQRDWDLPQNNQDDTFWQRRVLHHRIRYAQTIAPHLNQINSVPVTLLNPVSNWFCNGLHRVMLS